jgi:NADPH-dependent ferric siderophore reductase
MEKKTEVEIIKREIEVKEKFYLTPNYIRIVLSGPEVLAYSPVRIGANNKLLVPAEDGTLVRRTYTLRALDLDKMEMTIDFVAHGETGPASKWAIKAVPGERLTVMMKNKTKELVPSVDWYLIAGDHTALPVVAAILEGLDQNAVGVAYLEVYEAADIQDLKKPSGVVIRWLFNALPGQSRQLTEQVIKTSIPEHQSKFVFAAAEYQTSSEINAFLKGMMLDQDQFRTFSYWRLGQAEG